jgi:hypothetical protein
MSAAYGHATSRFLFSIHAILSVVWPTHHKESDLCKPEVQPEIAVNVRSVCVYVYSGCHHGCCTCDQPNTYNICKFKLRNVILQGKLNTMLGN